MLTQAIYDKLSNDVTLTAMLAKYMGQAAIFTTRPAPANAAMPYIVTAGELVQGANDTKNTQGREVIREIACYCEATGSAVEIEQIAERVREVLHRQALTIDGYNWILTECSGPVEADETGYYGRVVSVRVIAERTIN